MDFNEMADKLFGSTAPAAQKSAAPAAVNQPTPAETPAGVDLDKAADVLFSETFARDVRLHDTSQEMDPAKADELAEDNELFRDQTYELRMLGEPHVQQLATLLNSVKVQPPTDEQRASWAKESTALLVSRYGEESARERVAVATEWLRTSPGLAKRLADAGLAGHPDLAEIGAELAWSWKLKYGR